LGSIVEILPHVNASLNGAATVLLIVGYVLIKQRREQAHKWTMLSCFAVSVAFLVCYLVYHALVGSKRFPDYPPAAIRYTYPAILLTHVVLAAAVPFLAVATIYFGLRDRRQRHVRLARWTFPIWLYVSITGVVVYMMLYQIFPPRAAVRIMQPTQTETAVLEESRFLLTFVAE
jgi:putative membrane protein